jgi:hypothetical protein
MRRRTRKMWTAQEDERMRELYPDAPPAALCAEFKRSINAIYNRARLLGLRRSRKYLESPHACRLRRDRSIGQATQFKPGDKPWNTGMKGYAPPESEATRFPKGHMPHNWVPVGTEVINDEGYLKRKVTDTRCTRTDWKFVHVMIWEQHHGPVPKGHAVVFLNRNKTDLRIENLEILTRAELMRRNSIHRYPEELRQVMKLAGKLRRTIEAQREEQN